MFEHAALAAKKAVDGENESEGQHELGREKSRCKRRKKGDSEDRQ